MEIVRFKLTTLCLQSRCSSHLSYTPKNSYLDRTRTCNRGTKTAVLPITPQDIKKVREVNHIHNYKIGTPYGLFLERVAGLKPAASTLARLRSNQLSYTRNLWSFSRFCALPANCASPHRTFRYST